MTGILQHIHLALQIYGESFSLFPLWIFDGKPLKKNFTKKFKNKNLVEQLKMLT
jgi:hypothetical protein